MRIFASLTLLLSIVLAVPAADDYQLDAMHAGVNFKISHIGLSWTFGRFNDVSGQFTIDAADPSKSAFALLIKTESVDTANSKRDDHLRSPDFLNAKQFPAMSFKSTSVKGIKDGYEVTGDFNFHGVTKALTFNLVGGRAGEFPKGVFRTGYTTEFVLKRADFGMDKMLEAIGNDVHVSISFEGVKK